MALGREDHPPRYPSPYPSSEAARKSRVDASRDRIGHQGVIKHQSNATCEMREIILSRCHSVESERESRLSEVCVCGVSGASKAKGATDQYVRVWRVVCVERQYSPRFTALDGMCEIVDGQRAQRRERGPGAARTLRSWI